MARSGSPHLDRRTIPFSGCCRTSCKAFLNNLSERWQSAPCAAQRAWESQRRGQNISKTRGKCRGIRKDVGGRSRDVNALRIKPL